MHYFYNTNLNAKATHQRSHETTISVDSYTNHWDNLLLEEHNLAIDEWKERRKKCSLQTLERHGLAISRAFALPDSEILGEKTVRIHDGSGGKNSNIGRVLDGGKTGAGKNGKDQGDEYKSSSNNGRNGRGRFRRPWNEVFSKGDILVMTSNGLGGFSSQSFRRECLVMDVGESWILAGVGKTWPMGVWDARKGFGSSKRSFPGDDSSYGYPVRLDKTPNAAALIPLRAQRSALQIVRETQEENRSGAMKIATWLTKTTKEQCKGYYQVRNRKRWAKTTPSHFRQLLAHKEGDTNFDSDEEEPVSLSTCLQEAIEQVTERKITSKNKSWATNANDSQKEAIVWALSRRISSIQGPPGTGKTRVAALLIATALEAARNKNDRDNVENSATDQNESTAVQDRPFRVLAVAHSNGAADVLLQALLDLGVPAIRAGRPAAISERVRHRSAIALAEKIPQVVRLREELARTTSDRSNIEWELQRCIEDAQDVLLDSAPVVVTSCVGAHQLSVRHDKLRDEENQRMQQDEVKADDLESLSYNNDNDARFPLVVLDEAAQCTEPALMCALVAARAEQLVMVGDTKQLPPTVASSSKELRKSLGISPMERLEKSGLVEQKTLQIQYRMVQPLLEHPSKYFYNGMVKSPEGGAFDTLTEDIEDPPGGFEWPNPSVPLAFVDVGKGDAEVLHESSMGLAGRSNPREAKLVATIVANILEAGELKPSQICVLTPYSKQVAVIRSALENESLLRRHQKSILDLSNEGKAKEFGPNSALSPLTESKARFRSIANIRVGTIDSFQGQETELVVFSAVRSNRFSELGFLRDQRRLCVALTRSRKGLIVLGDSMVLNSCRHWKALIKSCQDRHCFVSEDNLSLPLLSEKRAATSGDEYDVESDANSEDITINVDQNLNDITENGKNDEVGEREKLSTLKPDEEFLGLFSTPISDSE